MSSQTAILRVPIDDGWDAGTRLQVYADFGSGTVDTDTPLLARPFEVFPGQHALRGHGEQPYGRGRVGDGKAARPVTGVGRAIYGRTPYGSAPPFVEVPVNVPAAFGQWKFAVKAVDGAGNAQSAGLNEIEAVVSGTEPPPVKSFALHSIHLITGQATFDFTLTEE